MAGYPLDTVKVKIQTQDISNGRMMYKGTFDCLSQIINKEGVSIRVFCENKMLTVKFVGEGPV
jgi:hypothetical protein